MIRRSLSGKSLPVVEVVGRGMTRLFFDDGAGRKDYSTAFSFAEDVFDDNPFVTHHNRKYETLDGTGNHNF